MNAVLSEEDMARKAYAAYAAAVDNKNYQGLPMPEYDDLGEKIQQAWHYAVAVVIAEVVDFVEDKREANVDL